MPPPRSIVPAAAEQGSWRSSSRLEVEEEVEEVEEEVEEVEEEELVVQEAGEALGKEEARDGDRRRAQQQPPLEAPPPCRPDLLIPL